MNLVLLWENPVDFYWSGAAASPLPPLLA